MIRRIRHEFVLSEDDINSILKVNSFFDLFAEMDKLVKSMSEKVFRMLERSLEFTAEEMNENG